MNKEYNLILADPPWSYDNGGNGAAKSHYPTVNDETLARFPMSSLAANDCVLILWATWPKLDIAMNLLPGWGFKHKTGFPWIKLKDPPLFDLWGDPVLLPAYGTGYWVRGCSEPIIIATRGKAKPPEDSNLLGILCERMRHSQKPKSIYHYCEKLPGPYLELFARRRRPGWDVFGNEVEGSIKIEGWG